MCKVDTALRFESALCLTYAFVEHVSPSTLSD